MNIIDAYIPYPENSKINNPKRIITHCMGEYIQREHDNPPQYDHAVVFLNEYKLSAHYLVAPDGKIFQCRPDNERASHARGHNTDTIGVEFLVEGNHNYSSFIKRIESPYLTNVQFHAGVELYKEIMQQHSIQSIERHSDVSPGRKVDPGKGFPWDFFLRSVG